MPRPAKCRNVRDLGSFKGHWAIKVLTAGNYEVEVRRWPEESGKAINEALPAGDQVPGADKAFRAQPGLAIDAATATMRLNNEDLETKAVRDAMESVTFEVKLTKGVHKLSPYFSIPQGELGCFYAIVKKKS